VSLKKRKEGGKVKKKKKKEVLRVGALVVLAVGVAVGREDG